MTMIVTTSGKRKRAVAKATIRDGTGKLTINRKPHTNHDFINRLRIEEPLRIAKDQMGDLKFDIEVTVRGGGKEGQVEATRLAIARCLVEAIRKMDSKKADLLKKAYISYDRNLLVADTRRKEAYKPGDSKARAKRQKSYR